jgi:hypothetical protein
MPRPRSLYAETISGILAKLGSPATDPRHVEGFIRLEHRTLDGLSRRDFAFEVEVALGCIAEGGVAEAEALAVSYGL